jgi:hypothetical protein
MLAVPRINIAQMIGEEIATERPIVRAGVATFAGEDGDVLQTTQGAEEHLPEERKHAKVVRWRGNRERRVVDRLVPRVRGEREQDQRGEHDEDGDAADVVDPLAEFKASKRSQSDAREHHHHNSERDETVLRKPCGSRTDQVRDFGRHGVKDRGNDRDAVDPQIPRREKAAEIAKGFARPDVQAAFERHGAVQADHRSRHGHVESEHGGNPGERLRRAESAGDTNPGSTHNAEDLGEHEVAKAEGAVQFAAGLRTLRIMLGHGSNMVARNSGQCSAFSRRTRPHQDQRALDERRCSVGRSRYREKGSPVRTQAADQSTPWYFTLQP